MPNRLPHVLAIASAACVLAVCSSVTHADEKTDCMDAHAQSQELEHQSKLRASREKLLVCSRDVCPSMIRKECAEWLSKIDESMPSVVFDAHGPGGGEVFEVQVFYDGQPLVGELDGRAVPVDPGAHTFRYEFAGAPPVEEKVVIHQGEKNRKISIRFAPPKGSSSASATTRPTATATPSRKIPTATLILGGVGALALAGGVFFELKGLGKKSDLDDRGCKPNCPQSDVDAGKRDLLVGDLLVGVSVLSLGAAAYFWFAKPAESSTAAPITLMPMRGGGAMAGWTKSF